MEKEKKKRIIVSVCVAAGAVLVAIAMLAIYFAAVVPNKTKGEKTVTLIIIYAKNDYEYKNIKTSTETVYELLTEQDEPLNLKFVSESSGFGEYLVSLNGVKNDDKNGYYYMFKINGVYSGVGISDAAIKNGDIIEFEYGISNYDDDWNVLSVALKGKGKVFEYTRQVIIAAASVLTLAAIAFVVITIVKKDKI